MSEKILTGTVSNYSSQEAYDPEGNYYIHYKFSIDNHSLFCKTDKDFNIYDGHKIIVKVQEENSSFKVTGMINLINDTSFGKTSGLKLKAPQQEYMLIHSFLKEKQRLSERVYSSSYQHATRHLSYKLILENGEELSANANTGKQIKVGDEVYIYKPKGKTGVAEFFDLTNGTNSKPSLLLTLGFLTTLLLSLFSLFWFWNLPWSEKGFIVIMGGLFTIIGLLGFFGEGSSYLFQKKRYAEFLEKIEKANK